jgi:hypothetical protein
MRSTPTLLAIASMLCAATPAAQALGFGKVSNATTLGQPLNFAAGVHLDLNESVARDCVAAEVVAGDSRVPPEQVRATLEPGQGAQQRSVRVTTKAPIVEPVVTIKVTIGCGSRLSREFVAFIDPPLLKPQVATDLPPQRIDNQVAPLLAIVQGTELRPASMNDAPRRGEERTPGMPVRTRPAKRALATNAGAATTSTAAPRPARVARRTSGEPRVAGPRLRLDATEPVRLAAAPVSPTTAIKPAADAARTGHAAVNVAAAQTSHVLPEAVMAAQAAASSAAAAAASQASLLAQERERIRVLEHGIAQLRGEAQATRQSLAELQSQLQRAHDERYANPLVLGLAALSLLLAVIAALGWRRPQRRHWWEAAAEPALAATPAAAPAPVAAPVDENVQEDLPWTYERPVALPTQPAEIGGLEVTTVLEAFPTGSSAIAAGTGAPSTVDELIDLEQQREFFVVLGQDAAAAELLADHLRDRPDASPLPYLELLEIQRRQGDPAAHAAVRAGFAARFGVEAPAWDAEPALGSSLEEHPYTIAGLQSIWAHPPAVMQSLEAALLGRFAPDAGFGLAAYRELLLIYSIARDLAEHATVDPTPEPAYDDSTIDLLLPLEGAGREAPVLHLVASTGVPEAASDAAAASNAGAPTALDFDLSDWTEPEPPRTAAGSSRY